MVALNYVSMTVIPFVEKLYKNDGMLFISGRTIFMTQIDFEIAQRKIVYSWVATQLAEKEIF